MSDKNIEHMLGRMEATLGLILEEQKARRLEFKEIIDNQEAIRREQDLARKQREEQAGVVT